LHVDYCDSPDIMRYKFFAGLVVGGSSLSSDCKERLGKSAAHVLGLLANEGLDSKARLAVIDRGNLKSVIPTDVA